MRHGPLQSELILPFRKELQRLTEGGTKLIVAVSGGADSVALLRLLKDLQEELGLTLLVGHFDHRLRTDSAEDARWVAAMCEELKIAYEIGVATLEEMSSAKGIEESARRKRYAFLNNLAQANSCTQICVAHTQNDQVETVLHHIARGTGLKGLAGIPKQREIGDGIKVIRPLLNFRRETLLSYLAELKQDYRSDSTNKDTSFTRNRIRHEILPELRSQLNPQLDTALLKLAEQSAEAQEAIDAIAAAKLKDSQVITSTHSSLRLNVTLLRKQPRAIVVAAIMQLWERQRWPRKRMSQEHWRKLADLILGENHRGGVSCPGPIQVSKRGQILEFRYEPD